MSDERTEDAGDAGTKTSGPEEGEARDVAGAEIGAGPKRRGVAATLVGVLAFVMNVAACGLLIWRAERFALENFWSVETRLFAFPAAVTFLWGAMELFWWRRGGRMLPVLVILSALGLAAVVFIFDTYNVLIPYERWLQRGLPQPWER